MDSHDSYHRAIRTTSDEVVPHRTNRFSAFSGEINTL